MQSGHWQEVEVWGVGLAYLRGRGGITIEVSHPCRLRSVVQVDTYREAIDVQEVMSYESHQGQGSQHR
jgi:hypothetical protein